MDPFVLWLTVALAGVGAFTAWLVRQYIAHLESDIAYSRKAADRGTQAAEKAVSLADKVV